MISNVIMDYLWKLNNLKPGLRLQAFHTFPAPWINLDDPNLNSYMEQYGEVNHREIPDQEIVIDIDSEDIASGIRHADLVEDRIKRIGIKYQRYYSGGNGQHFHIWLDKQDMERVKMDFESSEIKTEYIKYIVGRELLHPEGINSHTCLQNKVLIQIEGQKHRKGGVKTLVSMQPGFNKIPPDVEEVLHRKRKTREERKAELRYVDRSYMPPCIEFLLSEKARNLNDGKKRAMFIVIGYFKRQNLPFEEVFTRTKEVTERHGWKVDDRVIKASIRSNDGLVGCPYTQLYLEELGKEYLCINCPYNLIYKFCTIK